MIGRARRRLRSALLAWSARGVWRLNRLRRRIGSADIVFIGDSITQFWLDNDPRFFLQGRVNVGVSGETTKEMRARFARDVIHARPRVVHIMGGTNDVWHGIPGDDACLVIANLRSMMERARGEGIVVVLAAPPPIAAYAAPLFGQPELLSPIRAALVELAQTPGVFNVDYETSLCDGDGALRPAYTTDGVHLTRRGYRAMRGQAETAIAAALRAARKP